MKEENNYDPLDEIYNMEWLTEKEREELDKDLIKLETTINKIKNKNHNERYYYKIKENKNAKVIYSMINGNNCDYNTTLYFNCCHCNQITYIDLQIQSVIEVNKIEFITKCTICKSHLQVEYKF